MERNQQIIVLAKAIEATFSSSEWTEVGYLTNTDHHINSHPRLLRSLNWGDNDYRGHVLDTVRHILEANNKNLKRLVEYQPIVTWLTNNDLDALQSLKSEIDGFSVPEVMPTGAEAVQLALADAQSLIESRGHTSAVDRVHTGLHGFLKRACSDAHLSFARDATANQLLKLLLESHPSFQDLGPHGHEVGKLVRSSLSIVDTMGTLRNRASLAHPNEQLLGRDEALLAINLCRSLLHFLDAKLKSTGASNAVDSAHKTPF